MQNAYVKDCEENFHGFFTATRLTCPKCEGDAHYKTFTAFLGFREIPDESEEEIDIVAINENSARDLAEHALEFFHEGLIILHIEERFGLFM